MTSNPMSTKMETFSEVKEGEPLKICLGSTSIHKKEAVLEAGKILGLNIELKEVGAESGVNAQPYGFEETHAGALNRAKGTLVESGANMALGIENGIVQVGDKHIDVAVVVVLLKDGRSFVGTSAGIEFPETAVEGARQQGFETVTVGSIIAKTLGGSETDPHSFLTGGKVSRRELLTEAVVAVLARAMS